MKFSISRNREVLGNFSSEILEVKTHTFIFWKLEKSFLCFLIGLKTFSSHFDFFFSLRHPKFGRIFKTNLLFPKSSYLREFFFPFRDSYFSLNFKLEKICTFLFKKFKLLYSARTLAFILRDRFKKFLSRTSKLPISLTPF